MAMLYILCAALTGWASYFEFGVGDTTGGTIFAIASGLWICGAIINAANHL